MSSARGSLCCSLPLPLSLVEAMGMGDWERDWDAREDWGYQWGLRFRQRKSELEYRGLALL